MKKTVLIISSVVIVSVLLVSCSLWKRSSPTPPTTTASVSIEELAFKPASLTVAKGTTVTWTNKDAVPHTVTSDTGVFNSGNMGQNATFSFTFNQIGTFPYHCAYHPSMTATVVAQ